MLTIEVQKERDWGGFRDLRQVLEGNAGSERCVGLTSNCEDVFSRTRRILKLAAIVHDNPGIIADAVRNNLALRDHACQDLDGLEMAVRGVTQTIQAEAQELLKGVNAVQHQIRDMD